jgi:predicted kinase
LMHGVSGSGKTTVSTEIVKAIGAIRVRSDVERKRLFVETLKPKTEDLHDPGLYHSDMTERTYDRLQDLARILLCAGYSVVVDATFLRQRQREAFRLLAKEQACAWFIVDVFAPEAVLAERIELRSQEGCDASDATVAIMERQQEIEESFTPAEHPHVISMDSTDPQAAISAMKKIKEKTES